MKRPITTTKPVLNRPRYGLPALLLLLGFGGLGCGIIGLVENVAPFNSPAYWAAETGTPVPTVTIFLGTTTPVYADTPVPELITTTPEWTTVTATPILPPPTETPIGFTATPFWVTTTPLYITETPEPPVMTTPGLPQIGFSTPEPLETPYYRVGRFYMYSDVYVGGPDGPVLRLIAHDSYPSPRQAQARYHFFTVRVTNYSSQDLIVPLSDLFFVRRVVQEGTLLHGRWSPQNEPLIAHGLPAYETQQLDPIPAGGQREIVLGFVLPQGEVSELGFITDWERPLPGGQPIWFYLHPDPLGPFVDAYRPPPPTPIVLGEGGDWLPDPDIPGGGMWPTTGSVTRGFGCATYYTGIDGEGFGCPAERPWFHNGVDIANSQGTAVWSVVDGTMLYAGPHTTGPDCSDIPGSLPPHEGLGNYQRISGQDGSGATTLHYFGHLSSFFVTSGPVDAGEAVALMGSTGCSTGPHLHWTMYQNGHLVDPALWAGPGP
jgi:hypothetical protein